MTKDESVLPDESLEPQQTRPGKRAPLPTNGRALGIVPRFQQLYDKALTDGEIAEITGLSPSEVIFHRESLGLPAHERPAGANSADRKNDALFRFYYDTGMYDAEIARRIGVSRQAVGLWRRRQEPPLHPNKPYPSRDECFLLWKRGMTDAEIAQRTGLEINSVRHWRYQFELPAPTKTYKEVDLETGATVTKDGVPDYMRYYKLGWNDAEIASATNRNQRTVQSWRRSHEPRLAPNIRGRPKLGSDQVHVPPDTRPLRQVVAMTVEEIAERTGLSIPNVHRAKKLPASAQKSRREAAERGEVITDRRRRVRVSERQEKSS